ncbi:MAG: ABC transporter substrate-binding protein [Betaproteobacteria bacterium]
MEHNIVARTILNILRLILCAFWMFGASGSYAGPVVLYAATDRQVVDPLIRDFESAHPDIKVIYQDLNSGELYDRFLSERESKDQADVLWSSAMNLQFKLVNDGYAAPHKSSETTALPTWAIWKGEAFGTTFEPIVIAYNKQLIALAEVPKTHAELVRFLREHPKQLHHRIATYDPRGSGLGYLLHTQDMEANPVSFWNLIRAFGRNDIILEPATADMLDHIAKGRATIGYNVLGSYALNRAASDPNIGIVLPSDYTLILSRIAFINRQAPHPKEARILMDYLLSQRGQTLLNQTGLFSVRNDVSTSDRLIVELRKQLGNAFRPIVISTGLLTYMDKMKRELFLGRWDAAMNPQLEKR